MRTEAKSGHQDEESHDKRNDTLRHPGYQEDDHEVENDCEDKERPYRANDGRNVRQKEQNS
jgi:hypothetical protein